MSGSQEQNQFTLDELDGRPLVTPIPVSLPPNFTKDNLLSFPAFKDWLTRFLPNLDLQMLPDHVFHKNPYKLLEIVVQSADWFHPKKLGFVKIQAKVQNYSFRHGNGDEKRDSLPGAVFLRGGSVGILLVLEEYDRNQPEKRFEPKTVLTIQPRIASGSLAFAEIPAGMLDDETGNFAGKAAAEIKEEVGIEIKSGDLFNMSEAATSGIHTYPWTSDSTRLPSEVIQNSMYPSAGGCDEFIPLMLCQKRLTHEMMEELNGKATGLRDEGENITLRIVPLKDLWKEGGRDGKALAALAYYEGLTREGRLPPMPMEPDAPSK